MKGSRFFLSLTSRVLAAVVLSSGFSTQASTLESRQPAHLDHRADPEWNVMEPRGRNYDVNFETEEGTWMSVDISPDGQWVVFDLLGHIYRVPATGGDAECLSQDSGIALNFHPRFSPDGKRIAFISDRGGQNNLWVMNADGANANPVFIDPLTRITSPDWTPDGKAIVAVREFPTYAMHRRSARIWQFPVDLPEVTPVQLAGQSSGKQAYWPSVAPDGEHVYYMQSTFAEALHGLQRRQHIRRLNPATKSEIPVTAGETARWYKSPGSTELAPEISPDGRWLAFARRIPGGYLGYRGHTLRGRTALWIRELSTGAERILMDPITLDMQNTHGMKNLRILPGYSWAGDSASLVLSQGGKIRRVWLDDGTVETIPFKARVQRTVSEQARSTHDIDDGPFAIRHIRWPSATADGKTAVFEAGGVIWRARLPDGGVTRLASTDEQEPHQFSPAISPDGKQVAYVTWDDHRLGHVWVAPLSGGAPKRISAEPARYLYPAWSGSGQAVIVVQGLGMTGKGLAIGESPLYRRIALPIGRGSAAVVEEQAAPAPVSIGPGNRLFLLAPRGPGEDTQVILAEGRPHPESHVLLMSKGMNDADPARIHLRFPAATQAAVSPLGEWVAYQENDDIWVTSLRHDRAEYVAPFVWEGPSPPEVVKEDETRGVQRISERGGIYPRWIDDNTLIYASANEINVYNASTGARQSHAIDLRLPRQVPQGTIALENARLVTLNGDEVIERGTILVRGSRIACVGDCIAGEADHRVDLEGKTIVPGFVDVHAHGYWFGPMPLIGDYNPAPLMYLAHGVTTTLDPSAAASSVFPVAEMIRAGKLLGPRVFTTADVLMPQSPQTGPGNYADAENMIARIAENGGISAKIYLTPRRDQRQMLAHAARAQGLSVTNEGADLYYNVGSILDGNTGFEHPMHHVPMWSDAIEFFSRTGAVYSPTLVVAGAGAWAEQYYQSRADAWNDAKLRRFMPWTELVRNINHSAKPKSEYSFPLMAEAVKDLVEAGGHAAIGGHGELWGLDSHWELWIYAEALEPLEALRVASLGGARMAGLDDDLGSIVVGKLADLIVLNSNPLEDIHNSVDITYVMKGGILYDDDTLDEIWPDQRTLPSPPWTEPEIYRTDVRKPDHWDRGRE